MTNPTDLQSMMGQTATDAEGSKIGKIGQIYLDDQTGQPVWVTVHTGLFGGKENFAPVYGSKVVGDDLQLAVSKSLVKDAPSVEADGHLEDEENDALYAHYNGYLGQHAQAEPAHSGGQREDLAGTPGVEGRDTSGPTTDDAMTRSEERLHVGTEQVEGGRARLRKYVVTKNVSTTVPLSHEQARIVREPITEANREQAMAGADITSEEHEIVLKAERPVVEKEVVAVERVKLATETVTEQVQVNETVRKEQIDETPEITADVDPTRK
jgi:uncharacterized protein (TIGR02271 family)